MAKDQTDPGARLVADTAVAEWLTQATQFGQVAGLKNRLDEIGARAIGGAAGTKVHAAPDAIASVAHTNATITTPGVTVTYDAAYARVTTRVDGTGTTSYTYKAAGQLGAGAVASIDGPLANDVLAYTYDVLGRVTGRALNSVGVTWAYDALGRTTSTTNPVGTVSYTYDGVTARLVSATYPNGQTSTYSYRDGEEDRRLQTIHHKHSGGTTQSKFDYGYDVVGNILSWQQQVESAAPTVWTFGYDAADQLTRALRQTTGGSPTMLQRLAYSYDAGGNRTAEQIGDQVTTATHDALNRLQAHAPGGPLAFVGSLSEAATVTIQGHAAPVDGSHGFRGAVAVPSGTSTVSVVARDASGNTATQDYEVTGAGQAATFTHDANGNLTGDGTRTFEWDARNRLVAVESGTHRSEFTYDGLDRRVRIVEKESGTTVRDAALIWADTTVIEERLTTGVVNRFYGEIEQHDGSARYLTRTTWEAFAR